MANYLRIGNNTFHVGDTVQVHYRILEKEKVSGKTKGEVKEEQKERTQIFEGIVIAIRGRGDGTSFVVRRIGVGAIGIERIFPLISPWIKQVVVKKRGDVRRAKLYYLRNQKGKDATFIKEKKISVIPNAAHGQKTLRKTGRRPRRSASTK